MKKIIVLLSVILFTTSLSFSQTRSPKKTVVTPHTAANPAIGTTSPASSAPAPSFKDLLKTMMEVTGSEATYNAVIIQMVSTFKTQKPEVPAAVWNEFGEEFTKAVSRDILDLLLPIYQKHFTEDDLKAAIAFYESPAGQKMALASPLVMRESMEAGQQWGMKVGADIAAKLKEKGY